MKLETFLSRLSSLRRKVADNTRPDGLVYISESDVKLIQVAFKEYCKSGAPSAEVALVQTMMNKMGLCK